MAMFEWSPKYSVGLASIDRQHLELVRLINELYEAMGNGQGATVITRVLDSLVRYTQTHFKFEENLFATHGYDDAADHKVAHDAFVRKVQELQAKVRAGERVSPVQVGSFLKEWLVEHIQGSDRAYAPFLVAKGVR